MILDLYFKRPLFWDYLFSSLISVSLFMAHLYKKITIPPNQDSYSLTGDLTNIALTIVGFILTILTLLITFKENSSNEIIMTEKKFNKFFGTAYYDESVKHLKNCIKSIIFIASLGFFLKLFLPMELRGNLFFFNLLGITIITMTIIRCLLILGNILELQKVK